MAARENQRKAAAPRRGQPETARISRCWTLLAAVSSVCTAASKCLLFLFVFRNTLTLLLPTDATEVPNLSLDLLEGRGFFTSQSNFEASWRPAMESTASQYDIKVD